MAITGKPQKPVPAAPLPPPADEETVRQLIHKGGSVATSAPQEAPSAIKPMLVQLRLYRDMLDEIDAVRKKARGRRRPAPSRHAWIVEAIEEKLDKEREI